MVNLHRHSEFSPLDGTGTADQWAHRAYELGQTALALTDHATLGGALHHVRACRNPEESDRSREERILPVLGVEAYHRHDRVDRSVESGWAPHLVLHAGSLAGWHSLMRITSDAYLTGFYGKPCVDRDLLERHNEGLFCSSACINSIIGRHIQAGDEDEAKAEIAAMLDIFGDRFRLEIMPHDFDVQRQVNLALVNLGQEMGVPIYASSDGHYPYREWAETQDIVFMSSRNETFASKAKKQEAGEDVYGTGLGTLFLMSEDDMRSLFSDHHPDIPSNVVDEAIAETDEVVRKMRWYRINRDPKLPDVRKWFPDVDGTLVQWCEEGLERVGRSDDDVYRERMEYELSVLRSKNVVDYMVLVGDTVRWAKEQGIRVGLGRGSAAGSLVSYLCGITAIDPIAYGLLFERFLNPDRKGLPDIDLDFDSDRRDEVKRYLARMYGEQNVADIISYQTFGPRSAIADIAKVRGIPNPDVDKVKSTLGDLDRNLQKLVADNEAMKAYSEKYPDAWRDSLRIDNMIKAPTKHAAGVVISDRPLTDYIPLQLNKGDAKDGSKDSIVTAFADRAEFQIISDYGFLKIDLLGIDGLSKHEYACKLIEERTGEKIDLNALPMLRDPTAIEPEVVDIFTRGLTLGIFQFGGRGITKLLRHIKPDRIDDLIAANALYRPGPMQSAFEYGDRKHDPDLISYWHPSVEPFLSLTYGLLCYQEQVMEIVKALGGFTPGQADTIRKIMSKLYRLPGDKARQIMGEWEPIWYAGCARSGLESEIAEYIWKLLIEFSDYSFNLSHAASYTLQACQDAWLKAFYPLEFYASLLTFAKKKAKKKGDDGSFVQQVVREGKALGVRINAPDVNLSVRGFGIVDDELRYGLTAINGIGGKAADLIMESRPYETYDDLAARSGLDVGERLALIRAGACDTLADRFHMLSIVEKPGRTNSRLWTVAEHLNHNRTLKKPRPVPEELEVPSVAEVRKAEIDALGTSITIPNSVERHADIIRGRIYSQTEFEDMERGDEVVVGGEIVRTKVIRTKTKNQEMAFVGLAFEDSEWSCTMFPRQYAAYSQLLESDAIMVHGKKDDRGQIIVDAAMDVERLVEEVQSEEATNDRQHGG